MYVYIKWGEVPNVKYENKFVNRSVTLLLSVFWSNLAMPLLTSKMNWDHFGICDEKICKKPINIYDLYAKCM